MYPSSSQLEIVSLTIGVVSDTWPGWSVAAASMEAGLHIALALSARPKGQLLATLYEWGRLACLGVGLGARYAHQSGVPVVKADTTDDSRVLVTGGRDGSVKLWCCAQLESDTAPSSFHSIQLSDGLRALRTIRNSKAFAVGSANDILLYRVESSRSGAKLVSSCKSPLDKGPVMCIEQFDTELESVILFAQAWLPYLPTYLLTSFLTYLLPYFLTSLLPYLLT